MAKFQTEAGIEGMTGKLSKRSRLVMRKKEWHYPDGRVFGEGPKEVYELRDRDYKHNPRSQAEQVQYERWKAVCQEASRIAKDPTHPRYQEMTDRHMAQLKGKPDPALGKKRICQFGNFVRAVLCHE
ncbi:MAG: hypothetical protein IKQ11_06150 [Paludibacteraceae bacterium]|nr:hypothetical protein [Paludibacteraceae bacterium]